MRQRDAANDEAILRAALQLLGELGYPRMSLAAVAAQAGVSKATVYLRFRTKAALALAAVARFHVEDAPRMRGETRSDLVRQLQHLRATLESLNGIALIGTLLAEEPHHPQLLQCFREGTVRERRDLLRSVLRAAQARGELARSADVEGTLHLLVGSYYARYLAGEHESRRRPRDAVDLVLGGLST